jgi:hypothetical protein
MDGFANLSLSTNAEEKCKLAENLQLTYYQRVYRNLLGESTNTEESCSTKIS